MPVLVDLPAPDTLRVEAPPFKPLGGRRRADLKEAEGPPERNDEVADESLMPLTSAEEELEEFEDCDTIRGRLDWGGEEELVEE